MWSVDLMNTRNVNCFHFGKRVTCNCAFVSRTGWKTKFTDSLGTVKLSRWYLQKRHSHMPSASCKLYGFL